MLSPALVGLALPLGLTGQVPAHFLNIVGFFVQTND
jgi:hypothetical protein